MRASTILFLIILAGLLVLTALGGIRVKVLMDQRAEDAVRVVDIRIPVHVVQVKEGSVEDIVFVTGRTEPFERVDVVAKLPAPGKLNKVFVKKGDEVRKGQKLATVDRDLLGPSFSEIGPYYKDYVIEAPSSGTVVSIIDSPGAMISAQMPAAVIMDLRRVKVKTSLIESDLGRVREGTAARVQVAAYPDRVFEAVVSRIEPVLDAFSHTATIEITINNPDRALMPGMFAKIELVSDVRYNVPILPKHAVFQRQAQNLAFVVDEQEMALKLTELELGYYDQKNYEVQEGVSVGDLVVDQDQVILKHMTRVSIKNPPEGWEPPTTPPESPPPPEGAERSESDSLHETPGADPAP